MIFDIIKEALPGVLGNWGTRGIFSGEQVNKGLKIRGTGEHRQFWGTGNIENQDFVFGEQGLFLEGNKGTGTPPGRASLKVHCTSFAVFFLFKLIMNTIF